MISASDFADWWDRQHEEYKEVLNRMVEDNPNVFAVGAATVFSIPSELGAGLVDCLRFGQGLAEGGWKGIGTDFLRLLGLAGPAGRVSRYVASGLARNLAIFAVKDPASHLGICTSVAVSKALTHAGAGTLFTKASDLARAMGKPLPEGIWADELVSIIRQLGGRVTNLGLPRSLDDVRRSAQALNRHESVLFAIKWTLTKTGDEAVHTLYAFKDGLGRVRYSDRTGHVVEKLAEFEKLLPNWEGIAAAKIATSGAQGAMLKIEGAKMLFLDGPEKLACLMIPLVRLVALNLDEVSDMEDLQRRFEEYRDLQTNPNKWTRTVVNLPPVEWLTGVQTRLKEMGIYNGPVNDKFDKLTKDAVIAFQKQYGLDPDGIPGPKTQAKLAEVFGA